MDSLTHLFLGGAIVAAIAPREQRGAALLAGAVLNSLPDIEVLPLEMFSNDPVVQMTWHRAATHSVFVLPIVGWLIWSVFRARGGRVQQSPLRWFWAIQAALLAHPLIDACTVYGTSLLWPLREPPAMAAGLFIADPLLTLPLVLACALGWLWRQHRRGTVAVFSGLATSALYLALAFGAKAQVERAAQQALELQGLGAAPRVSVPMPFNIVLWRVVAMTPDGFVEGQRSVVADRGPMRLNRHASDIRSLQAVRRFEAARRLTRFNHGFQLARVRGDRLVLCDLRMGVDPDYIFCFAVARIERGRWIEIPPEQLDWAVDGAGPRLRGMWHRMWNAPAAQSSPRRPAAPDAGVSEPDARDRRASSRYAAAGSVGDTPAMSASK